MLYQIEIGERKAQKEEKQSNPNAPSSPLIYGKLNYFYPVKLGYSNRYYWLTKATKMV
ncbi:MAG: hypothetical protein WDM90_10955 [Ferruginibacter sp.]